MSHDTVIWTDKRMARLRRDWVAEPRLTLDEIAELHGVSTSSIASKLRWLRENGYPDLPRRTDAAPPGKKKTTSATRRMRKGETTLPSLDSLKERK